MNVKTAEKNIKICAVICEYNPFHNGHLYQLQQIKRTGKFDLVMGIMSGNFTQRGEAAILDKFTRAKAAVTYGMDLVVELPVFFSSSPAEIFARGGVKLLSSLPDYCDLTLAFGCESGDEEKFLSLGETFLHEPAAFKEKLKSHLALGFSPAKARELAYGELFPDEKCEKFFSSPNNILGVEYAKAVLRVRAETGREISLLPLPRKGAEHAENTLRENFSSASAIRAALLYGDRTDGRFLSNLPERRLPPTENLLTLHAYEKLDAMEYYALLRATEEELRRISDCTEGLESALKRAAGIRFSAKEVIDEVTSKRYTSSRIRRILLANALGVTARVQRDFSEGELFLHPLALRAQKRETILAVLGDKRGHAPLVMRKSDVEKLREPAREAFLLNERADKVYAALSGRKSNPFATVFV